MKKSKFLSFIGGALAVAMMLSLIMVYSPGAQAAAYQFEALNPMGKIEAPYNNPLAKRDVTGISNKTVGLVSWEAYTDGTGRLSGGAAFKAALKTIMGAADYKEVIINQHFEQTQEWYDDLAGKVDAVVFAVAEDNATAYWGALHVREMEKRGIPATIVVTGRFEKTLELAAEDHGITALRSVVLPQNQWGGYYSNTVTATALANAALPGVIAALTSALTSAETSPAAIANKEAKESLVIAADDYIEATELYNEQALLRDFGDGFPLVMPTRQAVDDMLAGTTRAADEVLGRIRMRNGICTIEKLAINAVMAGAEPEYFPVIIAAMEVIAQGAEDLSYYYHALTTGDDYSLILILNGPIAQQLGVESNRGYMNAQRPANNTIGRAVKLAIRNIGYNIAPYVDTAMAGRISDHALIVVSENESPYGRGPSLTPHHQSVGYEAEQSTVTVVAAGPWSANDLTTITADPFQWRMAPNNAANFSLNRSLSTGTGYSVALDLMAYSLLKTRFSGAVGSTAYSHNINIPSGYTTLPQGANLTAGKDVIVYFASPAQAEILKLGYDQWGLGDEGDKVKTQEWFTLNGVNGVPFAAHKEVVQIFVVGDDVNYMRAFKSTGYGMDAFRTQLVTGATLTDAGKDATAPSQPLNVTAAQTAKGQITLNWDAPDRADNIIRYEVSIDGGTNWVSSGEALSYTFTGLKDGVTYNFLVRAVNDNDNARTFDNDTLEFTNSNSGRGAQAGVIFTSVAAVRIDGAALVTLRKNATMQMNVTKAPANATPGVVWSSSNPAWVTVDANGLVTGIMAGKTAVITAATAGGEIYSIVTVRVTA